MNAEILYEEPWVIVTNARNPLLRRRRIALADLMDETWALPPADSLTGALLVQAFRAQGLGYPRATIVTNTLPVRLAMLTAGPVLTIVPALALKFPRPIRRSRRCRSRFRRPAARSGSSRCKTAPSVRRRSSSSRRRARPRRHCARTEPASGRNRTLTIDRLVI